jgi:hypothetical protein
MSRLREEMKVIPQAAWVIAICVCLLFAVCTWLVFIPHDPRMSTWPGAGMALFTFGISLFLGVYTLLVGYVNGDARRRGMRHVMWTLLAIFIPNAIGFILYFILRDPLLQGCPQCGHTVSQGFAFCSKCGTALAHACPECRSAVQPGWSHCTKCGARLPAE